MKFPFFKTVALAGLMSIAWNCSSDDAAAVAAPSTATEGSYNVNVTSWLYNDGANDYLISSEDFTVRNTDGIIIALYDVSSGNIIDAEGNPMITGVDLNVLQVIQPANAAPVEETSSASADNSAPVNNNTQSSAASTDVEQPSDDNSANTPASSASQEKPASSSSVKANPTIAGVTITGNLTQSAKQKDKISTVTISGLDAEPTRQSWNLYWLELKYDNGTFTISGEVPEYFQDGEETEFFTIKGQTVEFTLAVGNVTASNNNNDSNDNNSNDNNQNNNTNTGDNNNNQQQQTASSASTAKSSASTTTVTSSAASFTTTGCPAINVKSGGRTGSGFASRYWDCCKPHCAWDGKGGIQTKACDASGNKISDANATSMCDGGNAGACLSQIPFMVDGCDNIGFAYAAVPSADGATCGKCYQLTFTGKGKYETKQNHKALAGKSLVIMVSNIGSDVEQGQFDIMIPGGGVGLFNGCSRMGWGDMGKQYGGLLSDCEAEVGYSAAATAMYTKRKECLVNKCNKTFANDSQAKQGCLFLANFMEAAGNPTHTYKEVECPTVLSSKF